MKFISFQLLLLLISMSCICGMCSKDDKTEPRPTIEDSKGYLVTIGINHLGQRDSVILAYGFGAFAVKPYGGIEPKYHWQVYNNGSNVWLIKNSEGKYLSYKPNAPLNEPKTTLLNSPTTESEFVMNKDGNKFYIQPVAHKNLYLNTKPLSSTVSEHRSIDFLPQSQMWFIVP